MPCLFLLLDFIKFISQTEMRQLYVFFSIMTHFWTDATSIPEGLLVQKWREIHLDATILQSLW